MSKINANIADYLSQIEALTNTNLQILKTLNDSFFTKSNHLFAEVNDTTYVIPSFISLENKVNMLQENFENLVKAPETCEAYFNFDGNTRAIEVRKYSHVPNGITLPTVTNYNVESNDIFKDFMTPIPYINMDLPGIPNDIFEVNVKKVVAKSDSLKTLFKNKLSYTVETTNELGEKVVTTQYNQSINETYGNIHKLLLNYEEDKDYVEYDTLYRLPIRKNIGTGTYVIESVVSDIIDDDLNELITLKLRNNLTDKTLSNKLTYKLFDDTIEKPLQVGDELINFDGTGKVIITEVKPSTNTIVVKVVNGEYLNFLGTDSYDTNNDTDIHDLSKIRFHAAVDFENDKYLKVPLEDDQFVFIGIALLNTRMNVQSSWGTGIIIDTYSLMNNNESFKTYYDNNVKNIGDVLFEMTSMITSPITSLSQDTFEQLTKIKPVVDPASISVMQINKHLNNSTTVKNIRDAYNQKKSSETTLSEVQTRINEINNKLSTISFDDANGIRLSYTAQLTKLNTQKNELMTAITNAINTISLNVNSAEIPIENAKYRIRGFYVPNIGVINSIDTSRHIIGIQVQYRYKNISTELGNAVSINSIDGNKTYIYSDWNTLYTKNKLKIATCVDGVYSYSYESDNEDRNEPSYNQIDIPISAGETVDMRIKVVYDFGQPYITMTSDWSDIVNIAFPEEFTKDVPVLTIIEENNNDIETNRFNNILETGGFQAHINDMIIDQNTTFYHKPDNIASGFYTAERKIIPLKDKLQSLSNDVAQIKSDILGATGNYKVSLTLGDTETEIYADRENVLTLESYNNFTELIDENGNKITTVNDGVYTFKDGVVSTFVNIHISNTGDTAMKLYSLFPGNRNVLLNNSSDIFVDKKNYCNDADKGIRFMYSSTLNEKAENNVSLQTQNQYITFRINDPWTGTSYYSDSVGVNEQNLQNSSKIQTIKKSDKLGMVVYPRVATKYGLCIDSDNARSYIVINPGESIIVPMYCAFVASEPNTSISKIISFDLRTSLYHDPVNYTFKVVGKNTVSVQDYLITANKRRFWNRLILPNKYNQTIK